MSVTIASPAFVLPTVISQPTKEWNRQKIAMLGQAGIGKSEFWAQDEGTFFIDTEGNLNHLAVKSLPCRSWDDLRNIYKLLEQANYDGRFPYATVCVDTYDRLVSYATEEVLEQARTRFTKNTINGIGDIPEGVGWFMLKSMVMGFLQKLEKLPCAKVLICHVTNKEIAEPTRKYHKDTINVGGQLGTETLAWANHILHIRATLVGTTLQRTVRSLPSDAIEAKSQGAIVPDMWVWTQSAKENYGKLRGLFT